MKRDPHPFMIISDKNFNRSISCGIRKREKWFVFTKDSLIWLTNIYQKYTCCGLEVQTIKRYQMTLTSGSWGQNKHFTTVSLQAANLLVPYHVLLWSSDLAPPTSPALAGALASQFLEYASSESFLLPPLHFKEAFSDFPD